MQDCIISGEDTDSGTPRFVVDPTGRRRRVGGRVTGLARAPPDGPVRIHRGHRQDGGDDGGRAGPDFTQSVALAAPRGGFVSFQLVVRMPEGGAYALSVKMPPPLEADLFREWFHLTRSLYRPDALVPVSAVYRSVMPEPDDPWFRFEA